MVERMLTVNKNAATKEGRNSKHPLFSVPLSYSVCELFPLSLPQKCHACGANDTVPSQYAGCCVTGMPARPILTPRILPNRGSLLQSNYTRWKMNLNVLI